MKSLTWTSKKAHKSELIAISVIEKGYQQGYRQKILLNILAQRPESMEVDVGYNFIHLTW